MFGIKTKIFGNQIFNIYAIVKTNNKFQNNTHLQKK